MAEELALGLPSCVDPLCDSSGLPGPVGFELLCGFSDSTGVVLGLLEVSVTVTGHTVVYRGIVSVTITSPPLPTGQLVMVGAQDVMVYTRVDHTVEIVYSEASVVEALYVLDTEAADESEAV